MKIIVDISNSKKEGLTGIKRKVEVNMYTDLMGDKMFTIPYLVKHYTESGLEYNKLEESGTLIADNENKITINTETLQYDKDGSLIGYYDYFILLQKVLPNRSIIENQIKSLDSRSYFDK